MRGTIGEAIGMKSVKRQEGHPIWRHSALIHPAFHTRIAIMHTPCVEVGMPVVPVMGVCDRHDQYTRRLAAVSTRDNYDNDSNQFNFYMRNSPPCGSGATIPGGKAPDMPLPPE